MFSEEDAFGYFLQGIINSSSAKSVELTLLCSAVWDNKIREVEFLLSTGDHDVNEKLQDGRTALYMAILQGLYKMVTLLIHHGANVNDRDEKGYTPLHLACYLGNKNIVKFLLSKKADVRAKCSMMVTPILAVSANMSEDSTDTNEIISMLIENGANVREKMPFTDFSPLHFAVVKKNLSVVELLIKCKADTNLIVKVNQEPLLFFAIESNSVKIVEAFLNSKNFDVSISDGDLNSLLHKACHVGNLQIVQMLVKRKFDINAQNRYFLPPMFFAIGMGRKHTHVAEYLLQQDSINVNLPIKRPNLLLDTVMSLKDPKVMSQTQIKRLDQIIKRIIDRTENINAEGDDMITPLLFAAKHCDLQSAKYLIQKGANVNLTETQKAFISDARSSDFCFRSALQYACKHKNNIEMVKLLLLHGADVNDTSNKPKQKPLAVAIQSGDFQIVKELQNYGAQIDKENYLKNKEAARIAHSTTELEERKKINDLLKLNLDFLKNVRSNKYDEVKKNIEDGACVNVSSERRGSALIYVAWKGYEEIVDLLLDNGADVNFKSATGFTALHMACRFHSNDNIVRKLLHHGAYYDMKDGKTGKTPLKHAEAGKNRDIIDLLHLIDNLFASVTNPYDPNVYHRIELMNSAKQLGLVHVFEIMKVVKNYAGETLIGVARKMNYSFLERLEEVLTE
ncbi:ankyrin-3 [Diaphorina citri]|uniref:Ankyrin-3 n=1 Tax=Diaphorina citri TaxID=121845 RepID=A0A1S3DFY1_DIACI|nr:ankyrin-3 [Diaphorina citri]